MNTTTQTNIIGRNIHYTGDMANAPRDGIVSEIIETEWATEAVILWDEDENTGWDEGEAVTYYAPASRVSVNVIREAGEATRSDRFILN